MPEKPTTEDMKGEVTLTFTVTSSNVFDHAKKVSILKQFAALPMDDQLRIEQIITNPKALKALKDHEQLLKSMY